MAERGRANCCLSWVKAFSKGDGTTPSHYIWSEGEGEREKGQLKKGFMEMNSFAVHSQFKSSTGWQRHEHEVFPGLRAGSPVPAAVFALHQHDPKSIGTAQC